MTRDEELIAAGEGLDMAIGRAVMSMTHTMDSRWTDIVLDTLWPAQKLWRETVAYTKNMEVENVRK